MYPDRGSGLELRRRKGSESESKDGWSTSHAFTTNYGNGTNVLTMHSTSNCSRDRTMEFASTVRSLEGAMMNFHRPIEHPSFQNGSRREVYKRAKEFNQIARSIGRDIANTYIKLDKLTLLAKRRTIFDDRPQEIQELTFIIKEDMHCLNQQINQLQQIARNQQMSSYSNSKQQFKHSSAVVVALQSKLAAMTGDFKSVLKVRTENMKESRSRQQQFSSQESVSTSMMPQPAMAGFENGSLIAALEDEDSNRGGDFSISMDGVRTMAKRDQATESYLQNRSDTMQNIESTIVELGGIFQQLAHMVKEQEETMMRIDANVEDTALQVEGGHAELLKYFQKVTSNRWLMIKIFGVLIFFFIFFVIFMT